MAEDPVSRMTVDESAAVAKSGYKGKAYYFCAKGCKETFENEPDKFIES